MGGLIFLTVLIISSLVIINGDERDRHWVEGVISHERGASPDTTRVICFKHPDVCGILQSWRTDQSDIIIDVYFPKKYDSRGYIATTLQVLRPNVIYYFPFEIRNPIYGDSQYCDFYESLDSGLRGYQCIYLITINLYDDDAKVLHGTEEQLYDCSVEKNHIKDSVKCRKMLLGLMPVEQHRSTMEVRPASLSRYYKKQNK